MALLKAYNAADPQDAVEGIGPSRRVEAKFFTNDPLMESDSININKPGRSIPSMFARMIYFRTAFESIKEIKVPANKPKPIYNQLVSLCLDVLYLVYRRDTRLHVVKWNRADQIQKLTKQRNSILKEAIEKQCNDYLLKTERNDEGAVEEVFRTDDIYLFYLDDTLIGGTSPFTFTFSSPDWSGLGQVKSLLDRDDDFREYIYKLYCTYSTKPSLREFMTYVGRCKEHHEQKRALKELQVGGVGISGLKETYSQYDNDGIRVWVSQLPEILLFSRKPDEFTSDFFIDSPLQNGVDVINTPLFLCEGYHSGLHYVGTKMWRNDIDVNSTHFDDNDVKSRPLPGTDKTENHIYLSKNDFLEPVLMKLPYAVDEQKFTAITVTNGNSSYLLPLRPMFFKFFGIDAIGSVFKWNIDPLKNKCIVTLTIPVTNANGTKKNNLVAEKEYDLVNDVKSWGGRESVNLGVFPFYRIPQGDTHFPSLTNRYVVMHNINGEGEEFQTSELAFYREGYKQPIDGITAIEMKDNVKAIYYHLDNEKQDNGFDYIQMQWKQDDHILLCIAGIVIPKFTTPDSGKNEYTYAIDFGTTNTHVAFKSSGDTNPKSFTSQEIKLQASYLNTLGDFGNANAEILENEKRNFFPHIEDDSYTFPMRTASKVQGSVTDNVVKLFSSACIGFNYSKEFIRNDYEADLKWQLDNPKALAETKNLCRLFCEEMLWMVRNHWLNQTSANKQKKPTIVITYPQAMTMHGQLVAYWEDAYKHIFESNNSAVKEMVESLAPCFQKINSTAIGSNALLNIDIGGGTTDLQYYREWILKGQKQIDCYYTSVLFAGDDLWGKAYEHVGTVEGADEVNNFKTAAKGFITKIKINGQYESIDKIEDLDCKEFISWLLRDEDHSLTDSLKNHANDDVCRKTLFLHYSAIIYYVSLWLRDNGLMNPKTIQFTGLGSKYITLLFGDNGKLAALTERIITKVTGQDMEGKIDIVVSDRPKHATAEGASLYTSARAIKNITAYQPGIDGLDFRINGNELSNYENGLMESFDKFIETYNSLPSDIGGVYIPKLSEVEKNDFRAKAVTSLQQMIGYYTDKFGGENAKSVNDPMFFWPFKGALSQLI